MGGRGPRTPLQPVPACEYGLWLMCKNKIWGAGRVGVEGLVESPADISPQVWDPPMNRQKGESPNRTCSGCRYKCQASARVSVLEDVGVWAWATAGPGREPA